MGRAFERLSPSFRKRLEGLNAIHTTTNPIMREIRDNGDLAVLRRPISKSCDKAEGLVCELVLYAEHRWLGRRRIGSVSSQVPREAITEQS
jgi:hypothetical protein